MVRDYEAIQVIDLTRKDLVEVVKNLTADVEPYGVEITKINVTYAQPPDDFMRSLERRLRAPLVTYSFHAPLPHVCKPFPRTLHRLGRDRRASRRTVEG